MKKLKYVFWLILVILVGLVVYQNLEFFSSKHSLVLNLGFYQQTTPALTTGAIIATFVAIGVLIMMMLYTVSRYNGYRAQKNIKSLQSGIDERDNTIAQLTQEVEQLKVGGSAAIALDVAEDVAEKKSQDDIQGSTQAQNTTTP